MGAEVLLFATSGTSDLPMEGISFATKGVNQLLEQVFKLNTQDFLFKMQG